MRRFLGGPCGFLAGDTRRGDERDVGGVLGGRCWLLVAAAEDDDEDDGDPDKGALGEGGREADFGAGDLRAALVGDLAAWGEEDAGGGVSSTFGLSCGGWRRGDGLVGDEGGRDTAGGRSVGGWRGAGAALVVVDDPRIGDVMLVLFAAGGEATLPTIGSGRPPFGDSGLAARLPRLGGDGDEGVFDDLATAGDFGGRLAVRRPPAITGRLTIGRPEDFVRAICRFKDKKDIALR